MAKQLLYTDEARQKILVGVNKLARVVKATMGPGGRWVAYDKSYGGPGVINDGVTVAKEVELEDPFENMGAQMVRQVASKTNDVVGDGTTTATTLAAAIYSEGVRYITAGHNPMAIKRGIEAAVEAVLQNITEQAKPCTSKGDLARVATISANDDEMLGKLIADAMDKVGKDGVVTVEEGKGTGTELEVVNGMRFDKGYLSPYFVTDTNAMTCELEDCYILLFEKKISSLREFLPLLEKIVSTSKPFVIISEETEGEALAALVINKLRGLMKCCSVKAPAFGDRRKALMGDIAVMTGGRFISEDQASSLRMWSPADLGRAKKHCDRQRKHDDRRRRREEVRRCGPRRADQSEHRNHDQRLRQGKAAGTPGQTGGRRGRDPRRRADGIGDEGNEGTHQRRRELGSKRRLRKASSQAAEWRCCARSRPSKRPRANCAETKSMARTSWRKPSSIPAAQSPTTPDTMVRWWSKT